MTPLARTCSCGRRRMPGQVCACGAGGPRRVDEGARTRSQPYREAYKHASYRRNRQARYELVAGLCELCSVELKGSLYPDGTAWECHHALEPWRFADPVSANAVENLRCHCVPCHKAVTRSRRRR